MVNPLGSQGPSPSQPGVPPSVGPARGRHRITSDPLPQPRRPDIQGLRAVAVLSVVVNHVTGHPRGGFVGVDVFFVISGYLITGLLLRDRGGAGLGGYLGTFYRRRVRRLLPSAMLVIAGTLVASWSLLPSARFHSVTQDGAWSSIFWANWHFAATGTNYFTANGPTSPLQHYWSLSVEEQFYLAWPVILFALTAHAAARRSTWNRHATAVAVATVLSGVSLWIAFGQSTSEPTVAYFSTFDRAWELGVGAFLAGALPYVRVPARWSGPLSLGGLALIAVSLFTTHGGAGFPAPGAVLPCVGAAVVIAAGAGEATTRGPLTSRFAVWVGDISYPMYLVHFPVFVLLAARTSRRDAYFYVTVAALTLGLSVLVHALVEQPVLRSRWLLRPEQTRPPRPARRRAVAVLAAVGVVSCLVGVASNALAPSPGAGDASQFRQVQQAQRAASTATSGARPTSSGSAPSPLPPSTPQATKLSGLIASALAATTYPALQPTMDEVIAGPQARQQFVHCALVALQSADGCTWGSLTAPHLIYLIGDSTSMVYAEALADVVEHTPGWRMRFAGAYGCHFATVVFQNPQTAVQDQCQAHTDAVTHEIERVHPDVLVVSHAFHNYTVVGQSGLITSQQYAAYIGGQLKKVRSSVGKLVVLAPPPGGKDPATCFHDGAPPIECVYRPPVLWSRIAVAMKAMTTSLHGSYVNSQDWFCSAAGYCPPFVSSTPVMHDATHAAPGYMDVIWPAVKEALTGVGVFPG